MHVDGARGEDARRHCHEDPRDGAPAEEQKPEQHGHEVEEPGRERGSVVQEDRQRADQQHRDGHHGAPADRPHDEDEQARHRVRQPLRRERRIVATEARLGEVQPDQDRRHQEQQHPGERLDGLLLERLDARAPGAPRPRRAWRILTHGASRKATPAPTAGGSARSAGPRRPRIPLPPPRPPLSPSSASAALRHTANAHRLRRPREPRHQARLCHSCQGTEALADGTVRPRTGIPFAHAQRDRPRAVVPRGPLAPRGAVAASEHRPSPLAAAEALAQGRPRGDAHDEFAHRGGNRTARPPGAAGPAARRQRRRGRRSEPGQHEADHGCVIVSNHGARVDRGNVARDAHRGLRVVLGLLTSAGAFSIPAPAPGER